MARPAPLFLTVALVACSALAVVAVSRTNVLQDADAAPAVIAPQQACAATMDEWMVSSTWPADEILLGDQLYGRDRLFNLANSRGNAVADLALAMATAQLNLAAGAEPSRDVIEALFAADNWLLDGHDDAQRSQENSSEIGELVSTLAAFNDWAADASDCAPAPGALAHVTAGANMSPTL